MKIKKFLFGMTSLSMVSAVAMPLSGCAIKPKIDDVKPIMVDDNTRSNATSVPVVVDNTRLETSVISSKTLISLSDINKQVVISAIDSDNYVVDDIESISCGGIEFIEDSDYFDVEYNNGTTSFTLGAGLVDVAILKQQPVVIKPLIATEKVRKVWVPNKSVICETKTINYKEVPEDITVSLADMESPYHLSDKIQLTAGNDILIEDNDFTFELSDNKKTGVISFTEQAESKITGDLTIGVNTAANEGAYSLELYAHGYPIETIEAILPDTPTSNIDVTVPSWIAEKGKKPLDTSFELFEGETEIEISQVIIDGNKITLHFANEATFVSSQQAKLKFDLTMLDGSHSFAMDSWENLIFWIDTFNEDATIISKSYNVQPLPEYADKGLSENDYALGHSRTVMWDGMPHSVVVVSTNQEHLAVEGWKASKKQWYQPHGNPESRSGGTWLNQLNHRPTAAFTFKFDNVLTHANGEPAKIQFEESHTIDGMKNHWVCNKDPYDCWQYPDYIAINGFNSKLRKYIRDGFGQWPFKANFSDKGLVDAVRTIAVPHLIWHGSDGPGSQEALVPDQFFIPTCYQIGAPAKCDGKNHWYYTENSNDSKPFELYSDEMKPDKPDIDIECQWRICPAVGGGMDEGVIYWTASPSARGSGIGQIDDCVDIDVNGALSHTDMTDKRGILPCFCI